MAVNTTWYFKNDSMATELPLEDTGLGHFVTVEVPRRNVPDPISSLVVQTHPRTSGEYTCEVTWGDGGVERETSTIAVESKLLCCCCIRGGSRSGWTLTAFTEAFRVRE